jgi:hypothetical protein
MVLKMAIIKSKELDTGASGEYWVAEPKINMLAKQTEVIMLLFKNKATRDAGKTFLYRMKVPVIEGIYLTGEQVYAGVKASRQVLVSEAIEAKDAVVDDEGNIVEEAVEGKEAVYEESNWFADAEDVL